MRIVKSQAHAMLQAENAQLVAQKDKCWRQVSKFESLNFGVMSGKSVEAAEQKLRLQAAIGTAHIAFYESLVMANSKNMALVHALPETSPGVLDTTVAQERMETALLEVRSLQRGMESALGEVRRINDYLWQVFCDASDEGGVVDWNPIDEGPIRAHYSSLIDGQRLVAHANKAILSRASEYDRKSLELYRGVQTSFLRQALGSSNTFLSTGTWGNTSWVASLQSFAASGGIQRPRAPSSKPENPIQAFLRGDLKEETSVIGCEARATTTFLGIPVSGAVSGDLIGLSLMIKPYGKESKKQGVDDGRSSGFGGTAEFAAYGAKAKAEGSYGLLDVSTKTEGLAGSVSATAGVSLLNKGTWDPSLELGGKLEGSVMSSETSGSLGTKECDLHAKAEGNALTAKSEAKVRLGMDGTEARIGAEAYAATGELTCGFTLMGVKVDASVEGKAAGAGAKVGAKLEGSSAEGEIGVGLGLGAGVSVKVDWSGAVELLDPVGVRMGKWWDSLWTGDQAA